jgi:hypothetical protein
MPRLGSEGKSALGRLRESAYYRTASLTTTITREGCSGGFVICDGRNRRRNMRNIGPGCIAELGDPAIFDLDL